MRKEKPTMVLRVNLGMWETENKLGKSRRVMKKIRGDMPTAWDKK